MEKNLFSRLTVEEKRRALDLNEIFLLGVLKSRHGDAVVTGIGVEEELALAEKMSDEDIRQAIEIVEWHKQAMAASEASEHQTAIECFEKIVQQAPFDAISWMSLGVQHAFLQNGPTAIDCLERALSEAPDNERIRGNLEAVRADFGLVETAPPVETPVTVPPVQSASVTSQPEANVSRTGVAKQHVRKFWNSTGMEADRKRGYHSCDCCETPIAVNAGCLAKPNSGKPLSVDVTELKAKVAPERFQKLTQKIAKVAAVFKQLSATEGANFHGVEDRARELLSESPFDTRILMALGVIQFKQNKLDEALAFFSEAHRCAPADSVIHFHLGKVHERLGKMERALRHYDRARRLDFTSAAMRKAYYRLEHQVHSPSKSSKALSKANVEKLLGDDEHDKLVCFAAAAVDGLAQIIEDEDQYDYHESAAAVLSRIAEPAVSALARRIRKDKTTHNLRREVIGALSMIASDDAISILRRAKETLAVAKKFDTNYHLVVAALFRTGNKDALQSLVPLLRDKNETIRLATLEGLRSVLDCHLAMLEPGIFDSLALAILADVSIVEALIERCGNDDDERCRDAARQALVFTRAVYAPQFIAHSLQNLNSTERSIASDLIRVLAEQHVPLSLTGGATPSAFKRGDVWDVSGWTGNDGAIVRLIPLLGDDNKEVQQHVGLTLGCLGDLALPALVAAARTADDDVRMGLGWASQTMHDAGRRILADCGMNLTGCQRGQQVIKIKSKSLSSGVMPGDVHIPVPSDHAQRYLFRDAKGRDHPLQVVLVGDERTLWGLDNDEVPDGAIVEAIEHSKPGEVVISKSIGKVSDEVRKLNDALPNVWKAVKFSTEPCACCGIHMPTSEDSDFMNLGFLGVLQNNPQAIATAIQVTAAYYRESSGPDLTNVNMLFARGSIFNWACMQRCKRCKSWVCKRCQKLPRDRGGCSLCSRERKRRETMPSLVCETCFTKRQFEPWERPRQTANEPDISAVPIPRRDKATQMVKPFYEKWSVAPVTECTACGLLMPTTAVMQPLLKRVTKETGQDYGASLDAFAKLFVMILGPDTLGEPRNKTEQEQLIQKWHLTNCQHCGKPLCPACGKLGSKKRCVVCGTK